MFRMENLNAHWLPEMPEDGRPVELKENGLHEIHGSALHELGIQRMQENNLPELPGSQPSR